MPAKQHSEQPADAERQQREHLTVLIGRQVIHMLGKPGDLQKVDVRPLWGGCYRVNILSGENAASVKIINSYFLETDGDGNIVGSTPTITRQY